MANYWSKNIWIIKTNQLISLQNIRPSLLYYYPAYAQLNVGTKNNPVAAPLYQL